MKKDNLIWDLYIGSDINGTVSITEDNKLLCSIEKQYIKGNGRIVKINPLKHTSQCIEWFFPTGDLLDTNIFTGW